MPKQDCKGEVRVLKHFGVKRIRKMAKKNKVSRGFGHLAKNSFIHQDTDKYGWNHEIVKF